MAIAVDRYRGFDRLEVTSPGLPFPRLDDSERAADAPLVALFAEADRDRRLVVGASLVMP
jgi:hypothetical protein